MKALVAKLRHSDYVHYSWTYLATFILSLHYVLVVYISSTYLLQFATEREVSLLYAVGALVTILILLLASRILRLLGNRVMLQTLIVLEAACLLVFAFGHSFPLIAFAFIVHQGITSVMLFNMDVFLESGIRRQEHIGGARGMFLSMMNGAYALGPIIAGAILFTGGFSKVYLASFVVLIPLFILVKNRFKNFADPHYPHLDIRRTMRAYFADRDFSALFSLSFTLQFFYAVMVIYTPVYLHLTLGFSFETIGIMFSIMLLPFVIFQIPGGLLADREGEHSFLIFGLFVMAFATGLATYLGAASPVVWTMLLFTTRIGAAIAEIMIESSFFRHIRGKDAGLVSVFRMGMPLAYVVAPLAVAMLLAFTELRFVFLALGIFIFWMSRHAFGLKNRHG